MKIEPEIYAAGLVAAKKAHGGRMSAREMDTVCAAIETVALLIAVEALQKAAGVCRKIAKEASEAGAHQTSVTAGECAELILALIDKSTTQSTETTDGD